MGAADEDPVETLVAAVERLGTGGHGPGAPAGRVPSAGRRGDASDVATEALRLAYRLLFGCEARRRGALVTDAEACQGLTRPPADLLASVSAALAEVPVGADPARTLGALHERVLLRRPRWDGGRLRLDGYDDRRRSQGSWFTPGRLVDHLLHECVEPAPGEVTGPAPAVCDPACGSGVFLVAAARLIAARTGVPVAEVVTGSVYGVDRDPAAVELTRVALWLELVRPGAPAPMPVLRLRVGDALLGTDAQHAAPPGTALTQEDADAWCAAYLGERRRLLHWPLAFPDVFARGGFDAVVGNPPFLNRLQRRTARSPGDAALLSAMGDGDLGPYTDLSAVFLHRAAGWVRPGGRVGLVQPQSLLAARDASGVRARLAAGCALESLWASDVPVFDAAVLTCAPVLRRGARQGPVRRSHGPGLTRLPARAVREGDLGGEWGFLLARGLGVPEVVLRRDTGTLGALAACTADFRDEYYGLAGRVHEASDVGGGVPLVTAGLVDPADCAWGRRPTRVLRRRWVAPVVDVAALDERLRRWAGARLVPKVLVAPQGPVVEAVADPEGEWLPSVPVVTVAVEPDDLWRVLAVLLAPAVSAHAAATYAGTALTMRSVKLSAAQVARLPLPADKGAWDEAAELVRVAQLDGAGRQEALVAAGRLTNRAYGVGDDVLSWWARRLRVSPSPGPAGP